MHVQRVSTLQRVLAPPHSGGAARAASTSSSAHNRNPFPFPTDSHPTPHQIFHLQPGASGADIKARYYDLVRAHHPDSPLCRALPRAERHARFQRITSAYDSLRHPSGVDPVRAELDRRRRAMHRRAAAYAHPHPRPSHEEWAASTDERRKDWLIITAGLLSLGAGLAPALLYPVAGATDRMHLTAAANLAQARREAREHGPARREVIRRIVRENQQRDRGDEDARSLDGS